jgi:hypothetical protein
MARDTDWEAIEREYRAGQLSVSEIGRQHGVSHTAINKRARKEAWARDLTERVRKEVSARLVSPEVSEANAQEAVETAAARGVALVRSHQASLGKANRIAEKLMSELEGSTDDNEAIVEAIEAATFNDANANRRNSMMKAVSLPSRAATLRELSQTLKNLIPLERQAFNLDASAGSDDPATKGDVANALARLNGGQRDQLRAIAEAVAGGSGGAA